MAHIARTTIIIIIIIIIIIMIMIINNNTIKIITEVTCISYLHVGECKYQLLSALSSTVNNSMITTH